MITKVTKDNQVKYAALFNDANAVLGIDSTDASAIGTIEEYFQAFGTITTQSDATKFVALPLDEPMFEINADTREIKIPSSFASHGLSVKGDQCAEIVYFSIDRYFDTTDLFAPEDKVEADKAIHIIIQWEILQSGAAKARGVSKALFEDVEILKEQKKLVFGWAINNDITSYTGSVRFSVRFYTINNENEVVFSLSTLTATAPIKDGLDFEISNGEFVTEIYDDAQMIRDRFTNSIVTDEEKKPETPLFFATGTVNGTEVFVPIKPLSDGFMIDNQWYVDLNEGSYKFMTQAYSTDGGTGKMIYAWRLNNSTAGIDTTHVSNKEFVITADEVWNDNKLYYVSAGNGEYTLLTTDRTVETLADIKAEQDVYERFGSYIATAAGTYKAIAQNRQKKGGEPGEEGVFAAEAATPEVIIPGPGELTLTTSIESTGMKDEVEVYQVCADAEGLATLPVMGDTSHDAANGWLVKDKVTYTWTTDDAEYGAALLPEATTVDAGTTNNLSVDLSAMTETELAKYDALYTVSAVASRNGVDTEAQTKVFRVTAPAAELALTVTNNNPIPLVAGAATLIVNVGNFDDVLHDEIEYHWYQYVSDDINAEDPTANDVEITTGITSEDDTSSLLVSAGGAYYCKAINHVNGSEAVSQSDLITVY